MAGRGGNEAVPERWGSRVQLSSSHWKLWGGQPGGQERGRKIYGEDTSWTHRDQPVGVQPTAGDGGLGVRKHENSSR